MYYVKEPILEIILLQKRYIQIQGNYNPLSVSTIGTTDLPENWTQTTQAPCTYLLETTLGKTLPRWVNFSLFWVEQLPGAITFLTITPLGEGLVTLRWRQSLQLQPNWHMTNLRINSSVHVLALNAICHHQEMGLRHRWKLHR